MIKDVLDYLEPNLRHEIENYLNQNKKHEIEEIRVRTNKNLNLKTGQTLITLNHIVTKDELLETFENICEKSIYSYTKQISEGFITVKGGNRVGITGSCVIENEKVTNINYISSLNFRIAREIKECSTPILRYVINIKENSIFNTLIVSSPGAGKTTILRDLIRKLSSGILDIGFKAKTCGLVDERNEISAMYKGIPQNDIGLFTDVITNVPKDIGINMLIRSMAPEIIMCDEIGSLTDILAIKKAFCSGVKGIFTAHASSIYEVMQNENLKNLVDEKLIKRIIVLSTEEKGKIKEVKEID